MTLDNFLSRGLLFGLIIALAATFATPCFGQEPDEEGIVYSIAADGKLNIRETPSAQAPIIGQLITGGEGARVLSTQGIWYKVLKGDVVGFVNALYVSARPDAERVPNANERRTTYYVVIGSYSSLDAIAKARYNMPDAIDSSPVFLGEKNGTKVYRMCSGFHYDRKAALREVELLKSTFGFTPWIWKSNGHAKCVDRPIGNDGNPVSITPDD